MANTSIRGDLALSRDITVARNAAIRGAVAIAGNLRVGGWLDAPNLSGPCKGLHASADALRRAYPRPVAGWWAYVGADLPAEIYVVDGGSWTATGNSGGTPPAFIHNYDDAIAELDDALSERIDDIDSQVAECIAGIEHPVSTKDCDDADLVLADEDENPIAVFAGGHIQTANFDSSTIADTVVAQVLERLGGGTTATVSTAQLHADMYMVPCYGQSLAIGTQSGATSFGSTEVLSVNTSLSADNIQDMSAGIAEGFRLAAADAGFTLPDTFRIIGCRVGAGGLSINTLSAGGTYYNQLLDKVREAQSACASRGLTLAVPAVAWTQGEEDMRCGGNAALYGSGDWDPATYHNRLIALAVSLDTDIKAITGQSLDVALITYQTSSHTSYGRYPRIAMEQALADDMCTQVYLVKPNYNVDYVTEDGSTDAGTGSLTHFEVHCPARAYREMGNHYGVAAFEWGVLMREPSRLRPVAIDVRGATVRLTFSVPTAPLVLDTDNVANLPDGNYGFGVYCVSEAAGATGSAISAAPTTITSVRVSAPTELTLTLSRAPQAGERLTYGVNGDFWQNVNGTIDSHSGEVDDLTTKAGRMHGPRGCLRDSSGLTNSAAPYRNLWHWCRYFEFRF